MIVENNAEDMRKLQSFVAKCYADSDIIAFTNSSDALNFIQSGKFSVDLCFTEVVMPGVSGFKLVTELREYNKQSKAVFIADTAEYAVEAWRYHVTDYLLKPVTLENVTHTLKAVFRVTADMDLQKADKYSKI
ncbi:MAG: LytR/AlgR family response regulator transcription factor [Hominilimicola sp.]